MTSRLFVYTIGLLALAAGCSDRPSPTAPATPEGSMSFTYSGRVTGEFGASGAAPSPGMGRGPYTFAVARRSVRGDRLLLAGFRARGSLQDVLNLDIPRPGSVGAYVLDGSTSGFVYGQPTVQVSLPGSLPEASFAIRAGEVVITTLSDTQISGRFTAHGESYDLFTGETSRVEVVEGVFDLPILTP